MMRNLSILALLVFGQGMPAFAATPFASIAASPDISIDLAGTTVSDEDVAEDDFVAVIPSNGPPGIPASADLDAYHRIGINDLFSLDTTVTLPGGLTAEPRDVVRWDGVSYTIEFDGSSNGIPNGARVDAVSIEASSGDLLLSFDLTIDFGDFIAADEDLVAFDGITFSLLFDGSAVGISESLDLDAVHYLDLNGNLAVSFDTSGEVSGIEFDDEDVLEYEPASGAWELVFDGSAQHSAWSQADLDAVHLVPEPETNLILVTGAGLLSVLRRRRMRRK